MTSMIHREEAERNWASTDKDSEGTGNAFGTGVIEEMEKTELLDQRLKSKEGYRVTALTVYTLQMRPYDTENQSIALQIST